jgi:Sulfotransferase family
MSNLVFVSGDYCSGSTLLFTLFRKTRQYYCLYEPLHDLLPQYLIWPMLPDDHHFFVEKYHSELKGFDKIPVLFNPRWGNTGLYLPPEADADGLYRYLSYLIGTAFSRCPKVMLKENRLTFRLGWLRAKFPHAKIVHIYRRKEDQWKSNVRRAQAWLGREDVGQQEVNYNGFSVAAWCEDLKGVFPELDAKNFRTGYDRFSKLWELSYAEHKRYADISVDYWALTHDFEQTCERIWACIGATGIDTASLKQFVIPPEKQKSASIFSAGLGERAKRLIDRAGRKYARARLRARAFFGQRSAAKGT